MRYRLRRRADETAELNITAFMNLMVVLVPFLLITAVFSRVTILQLNLPPGGANADDPKKKELQLEVVIRKDFVVVQDRNTGPLKKIPNNDEGLDHLALSEFLQAIKTRFPDKQNITVLSEQETSYSTLVSVMDTLRMARVVQSGSVVPVELFPDISIGDAPIKTVAKVSKKGNKS